MLLNVGKGYRNCRFGYSPSMTVQADEPAVAFPASIAALMKLTFA